MICANAMRRRISAARWSQWADRSKRCLSFKVEGLKFSIMATTYASGLTIKA